MNKELLNKHFAIDKLIGSEISEEEFLCLMCDGKVYTTRCEFESNHHAWAAIGGDLQDFPDWSHNVHGGHIVADSLKEAEQIAMQRGWGETIEGVLCGIIRSDHDMINPYDLSNNQQ